LYYLSRVVALDLQVVEGGPARISYPKVVLITFAAA
jgi:hypothetical protein